MITGLDHIGIAIKNLDSALPTFEQLLELELKHVDRSSEHGIKAAIFAVGETKIELLEPLDKESPISKFLENRGQGIHHLAFKVDNIEKALEQLKAKGVALIDQKPRIGIEGGKIAFLHPKETSNILIELCEC